MGGMSSGTIFIRMLLFDLGITVTGVTCVAKLIVMMRPNVTKASNGVRKMSSISNGS